MKILGIALLMGLSASTFAQTWVESPDDQKASITIEGDYVCWDESCPKEPWIETVSVSVTDMDGISAIRDWEMVIELEDLNGAVVSKSFVVQANVD